MMWVTATWGRSAAKSKEVSGEFYNVWRVVTLAAVQSDLNSEHVHIKHAAFLTY